VALAKDVNETRLTRKVIKELEEALIFAPEDEKILAWLEELSKL
jgi:hypothetical protein